MTRITEYINNVIQGDCVKAMSQLPEKIFHCCVTSPPYWGLRSYSGDQYQVWGGSEDCDHEWGSEVVKNGISGGLGNPEYQSKKKRQNFQSTPDSSSQFCIHCGAWYGALGLEPTPELFLSNMVLVFRAVWRVLRDDGTLWLNIGDSYAGGGRAGKEGIQKWGGIESGNQDRRYAPPIKPSGYLKPKDLCMIPARLAIALQQDGWYIRSDIIWAKGVSFSPDYQGNPMPESATDRPASSHEHMFLLTKKSCYFYDHEAVKEKCVTQENRPDGIVRNRIFEYDSKENKLRGFKKKTNDIINPQHHGHDINSGSNYRNLRNVWTIPTKGYKEAHFATFPPKLVEPCIKAATSEKGVCPDCGNQWERIIDKEFNAQSDVSIEKGIRTAEQLDQSSGMTGTPRGSNQSRTIGWKPTCECGKEPIPAIVLDHFGGSGTVAEVARRMGRSYTMIELAEEYVGLQHKRLSQEVLAL